MLQGSNIKTVEHYINTFIHKHFNNMKQNNIFNRLFHKKELIEEELNYQRCRKICGFFYEIEQELSTAQCLVDLLNLHKKAWALGYRNDNLAPLEWGMFRTSKIPEMTPDQVYLGNIYGLFTRNIPFWENSKDEKMYGNGFGPETTVYSIVLNQYKKHLCSNFISIRREASIYIDEYEELNK